MEIDINTIISSYATVTLFLMMLVIGLKEGFANLSLLWRRPMLLLRCLVASFVLVPLAAMVIVAIVPMGPAVKAGVAMMAICPGAPMLYRKLSGMKADTALAGSYQMTMSLFAVALVPLWILIINALYVRQDPSSFNGVVPLGDERLAIAEAFFRFQLPNRAQVPPEGIDFDALGSN